MNHQDHVNLLRPAVPPTSSGPWADFGSGAGAFTLALRDLVGPTTAIYSIEKDKSALDQQQRNFRVRFPQSNIHFVSADFTQPLDLPPLEGIVVANAIHFYRDKERLLRQFRAYLKPEGRLVVVEYNADRGNPWVPYPLSYDTLRGVTRAAGFREAELVSTVPSSFLRQIYSAVARRTG